MKPLQLAAILSAGMISAAFTPASAGADWSQFRGPRGDGVSEAVDVPTEWGPERNVIWKSVLPGHSNGSPILSAGRVFLTSADEEGHKRRLHCFDAKDGSVLWVRTVEYGKTMPTHKTNLYGGTTPVADSNRVVVWHSSAGLYCYDLDGNQIWHVDQGEFRHQWGYGTSPVLHKGKVILHSGPGQEVFMAAFELETGALIWKTEEPVENDGERNSVNKYMGSWSTPVITTVNGMPIAVCSMATRTNGYEPDTGQLLWSCEGLRGERGDLTYTSPVIADDLCIVMGGYKGPAMGFRMVGSGNITETARLWRDDKATPQRIGSGVFVDGSIYMANAGPNTIECIDPATGESRWQERGAGGAYWGSLVYADGRLYAADQNGTTTVFRANPGQYEPVSINRLNDPGNSTPAVADGAIFIRTFAHLYRIGRDTPQSDR